MAWDRARMEYFEIVHLEKMLEARRRIITQVLVIDRVVLQGVEEADQVMRLRDKHAIRFQHFDNTINDGMDVLNMCEAIGGRDNAGRPVIALDFARHFNAEI